MNLLRILPGGCINGDILRIIGEAEKSSVYYMEGSSILSHPEAQMSNSSLLMERPAPTPPRVVERTTSNPTLALAVILTVQLMLVLDVTVVNIALPQMQQVLHFSQSSLSWVL